MSLVCFCREKGRSGQYFFGVTIIIKKTLALFAHPGHELQCLISLKALNAKIVFLTDASASTGRSRVQQSATCLQTQGLCVSAHFSSVSDDHLYSMLLSLDKAEIFHQFECVRRLLKAETPDLILIDAAEGYNPAHDFCHFLALYAAREICPSATVLETPLTKHPHDFAYAQEADCRIMAFDAEARQNKYMAVEAYCDASDSVLRQEIVDMKERFGDAIFEKEILRPPLLLDDYLAGFTDQKPFFETHGERRALEMKYDKVLRLSPHLTHALDVISKRR